LGRGISATEVGGKGKGRGEAGGDLGAFRGVELKEGHRSKGLGGKRRGRKRRNRDV